jgi:predicted ATPase
VHRHPVKALAQELHAGGIGTVLLLPFLPPAEIAAYLRHRFGPGGPLDELADVLRRRTEGNPLFLVRMLDYAVVHGLITSADGTWRLSAAAGELGRSFPASLKDLIARQVTQVTDEERQFLEAASVVGKEFTLAEVAAALQLETDLVDRGCERLIEQHQLLEAAEPEQWPDDTMTVRARFRHVLYRDAIYEQLLPTRRVVWHGRIGARRAAAYGAHTEPIAAELAVHFSRAGNVPEAVRYYAQAGQVALSQQAHQVAVGQYTGALELLPRLPDTTERTQREVDLQLALGVARMATAGYAAAEVERTYARVLELCQKLSEAPELFPALYGLWAFHLTRAEHRTAQPLADRMLRLAQHAPGRHRSHILLYGHDPAVVCLGYLAWALWLLGYPDQAMQKSNEALALAREIAYAPSLASALHAATLIHNWRGEWSAALARVEESMTFATLHGLPFWSGMATFVQGWILGAQGRHEEGIAQMLQGQAMFRATGTQVGLSERLALLAECHRALGQREEAAAAVSEAESFYETSGQLSFAAEVARQKGLLFLPQYAGRSPGTRQSSRTSADARARRSPSRFGGATEAEACLLRARAIAQQQQARSHELRAAMSLAQLSRRRGQTRESHARLAEIYAWFTEGLDTEDLRKARALLKELA